jgi:hypothetical protein
MQDPGFELPRIRILGTSVNGTERRPTPQSSVVTRTWPTGLLSGVQPDLGSVLKVESFVRGVLGRTRDALVEAIGQALCAVSVQDARGFFEHAGSRPVGQLL